MLNIIKSSFFIPLVILLIIFSLLTITISNTKYQQSKELNILTNEIGYFKVISELVHEIQTERGLSSGYLASQGRVFAEEIVLQRAYAKHEVENFMQIINKQHARQYGKLKILLSQMEKIEHKIDTLDISANEAIEYYSTINSILLQSIVEVAEQSTSVDIRNKILAYSHFLKLKEYAGIQRALGTEIILQNTVNLKSKLHYYKMIVKYDMHREKFLRITKQQSSSYYKFDSNPRVDLKIKSLSQIILKSSPGSTLNIDITTWFDLMSQKINLLKATEDHLTNNILNTIKKKQLTYNNKIFIFIFINFFSIALFIYMIMKIVTILNNEKKLKDMIDKYIIFSITDLKGNITSASSAFCKVSGYTKEELIGKNHNIIRHPDMKKELFEELWKTIKRGNKFNKSIKNRTKEGGYYWVNANIEPIFDLTGKTVSYIAIKHDITDKKIIEELNSSLEEKIECEVEKSRQRDQKIIEQSRLAQMGEMISMIAHQWRQPLNSLSMIIQGASLKHKLGKFNDETMFKLARDSQKQIMQMSQTIDDFRHFSKPNKHAKEFSVNASINHVLTLLKPMLDQYMISVEFDAKEEILIKGFSNDLGQVVINIVNNAKDTLIEKNKGEEKMIHIMLKKESTNVVISIEDNGGGIVDDVITKIFDPYFSTKEKKNGTGLGLYMSKNIIESHNHGSLSVENSNKGAMFKIVLGESYE